MNRTFLVKNGVPFDVSWSMDATWVLAHCIAFGMLEGNEFNWDSMAWIEKG